MNPYEVLGMRNYTEERDRDYEKVNSELVRLYEFKKKFLEDKIRLLIRKFKLTEVDGQIEEIEDYMQKIQELYGPISDNEEVEWINKKIADINKAIEIIKSSKDDIENLERAYNMIRTPDLRLIQSIEALKKESETTDGLIHKVRYKKVEESEQTDLNAEQFLISLRKTGTLGYVNWTRKYSSYINQYTASISSGDKSIDVTIYTELPEIDLQDEKFQMFLLNKILTPKYMSYAIKNNGGYLGTPVKKADGNYEVDFNIEDFAAVMEYVKSLEEQNKKNENSSQDGQEI